MTFTIEPYLPWKHEDLFRLEDAMSKKQKSPEMCVAWAWEFPNVLPRTGWALCAWAEPSRKMLLASHDKPTDDARPVCVRIIRNRDYLNRRA